jgi:hypothetical protein
MADRMLNGVSDQQLNPFEMDYTPPQKPVNGLLAGSELIAAPGRAIGKAVSSVMPPVYIDPQAKQTAMDFGKYTMQSLDKALVNPIRQTEQGQEVLNTMSDYVRAGVDFLGTDEGKATVNMIEGSSFWVPFVRAAGGARELVQIFAQNLTNNMKKPDGSDFYKNPNDYMVEFADQPWFQAAPEYIQDKIARTAAGVSKLKATGQGVATGIKNTLLQKATAQGQADWRQNQTSVTLRNLVEEDAPEHLQSGQMLYENLVGSQMNNLSPLLKQLDDEFFVHKSVLNIDDFKKFMGDQLGDEDLEALWRTVMANNNINRQGEFVMVGRNPRGSGRTGQLDYLTMHKGIVPRQLDTLFPLAKPFNNSKEFIDALERNPNFSWAGNADVADVRKRMIEWAWETNGDRLSTITDPKKLSQALQETVDKAPKEVRQLANGKTLSTRYPVDRVVKRAVYTSDKGSFGSNDELYGALKEIFPGAEFVPSGSKLFDEVRKRVPFGSRGKKNKSGVTVLRNSKQKDDPNVYIMHSGATSDAYELGAVNILYKLTPDGQLTAMVNDVNDIAIGLKDFDLPGAKKAIVITPPISRNIRTNSDKTMMALETEEGTVRKVGEQLKERPEVTTGDRVRAAEFTGVPAATAGAGMLSGNRPASPFDIK